jgi:hypothetical protein
VNGTYGAFGVCGKCTHKFNHKNEREGTGWEISYVRRDNIKMDLTC